MGVPQTFIVTLVVEAPDQERVLSVLNTMMDQRGLGPGDFRIRSVLSVDLVPSEGEEQVYLKFPRQQSREPRQQLVGAGNHLIEVIKVVREALSLGLRTAKEAVEMGRVGPMTRDVAEELQPELQKILGQTVQIISVR